MSNRKPVRLALVLASALLLWEGLLLVGGQAARPAGSAPRATLSGVAAVLETATLAIEGMT